MKRSLRLVQMLVIGLAFSFAVSAHAETAREEIAHSYRLLKLARDDYGGHKAAALEELKAAGHDLSMDMEGTSSEHEHQLKSDEQLTEAHRLLHEARDKLEDQDRNKAARHIEKAMKELDSALATK